MDWCSHVYNGGHQGPGYSTNQKLTKFKSNGKGQAGYITPSVIRHCDVRCGLFVWSGGTSGLANFVLFDELDSIYVCVSRL